MKTLIHAGAIALLLLGGSRLAAQESGISVGSKAPAVKVNDLDGKPVDLAQYIGKQPVLLEFWATWCELCEELLPRVRAAHAAYSSKVEFIGVKVPPSIKRLSGFAGTSTNTSPGSARCTTIRAAAFERTKCPPPRMWWWWIGRERWRIPAQAALRTSIRFCAGLPRTELSGRIE